MGKIVWVLSLSCLVVLVAANSLVSTSFSHSETEIVGLTDSEMMARVGSCPFLDDLTYEFGCDSPGAGGSCSTIWVPNPVPPQTPPFIPVCVGDGVITAGCNEVAINGLGGGSKVAIGNNCPNNYSFRPCNWNLITGCNLGPATDVPCDGIDFDILATC